MFNRSYMRMFGVELQLDPIVFDFRSSK